MALLGVSASPAAAVDSLWTQAQDLSAEQNDGEAPQVAIADDGSAVAVWRFNDPATNKERVQFAARKRGENFVVPGPRKPGETEAEHIARVEPTYLSNPAHEVTDNIRLKMNQAGDAIVVWEATDGSIRSAYKPAGGNFSAEQVVQSQNAAEPEVGIDGQGNATVISRGTVTRAGSVYRSDTRPAGAASVWGDDKQLLPHPSGFGSEASPLSYHEVHGSLAVDEAGNKSAVVSSDTDPDFDPANPPSDDSQKIIEVTSPPGAANWTVQYTEDLATDPYATHALRTSGRRLAAWELGTGLRAASTPSNPPGISDTPSSPGAGTTSTSGSAFALDGFPGGLYLGLWSTGSVLRASYVDDDINFDHDPDDDPVAGNAGATRTRPRLVEDANGSVLSVFKQKRGNDESIQVALRPPPAGGGTKFDAPVTVRGASGTDRTGAPVALSEPCDITGAVNCDLEPDTGKADPGPSIAMNSGGEAVAAWSQGDSGGGNLVVKVSLFIPRPSAAIPVPPAPPPRPKPAVPSLIVLARPLQRGEAAVLTLQPGAGTSTSASTRADDSGGPATSSEDATKLDWGFGTKNEPPVTGDEVNGALERSVRLRLPDRSFKATVEAQTPDGVRTFTRTFTAPNPPSTGDAGKVVDELQKLKTPPVFAVGATDTLTTKSKDCSAMKVWTGEQKIAGCFKPVENLVDIPGAERGAVHELADQLNLDESKKELMEKATGLTDSYVSEGKAILNDEFPVIPKGASDVVDLPQAKSLISAKAELPVGTASFDPKNGFNLKLDPKKVKIPLGKLPKPPNLPKLGGLEIVGDWDVDLDKQEAKIKASVVLPDVIKKAGVTLSNEVQLRATPDRLIVDGARVGPADVDLGGLKVTAFKLEYQREGDQWEGQAKACVISGACLDMAPPNGHILVKGGKLAFAGASLTFPTPGIPLFTGVNLERIGFGIGTDPTRMVGNVQIGVIQLIAVEGRVVLAFPDERTPFILRRDEVGNDFPAGLYGQSFTRPTTGVTGRVLLHVPEVSDIEFGHAYLLYEFPGYIALGGGFDLDLIDIVQLSGGVSAEVDIDRGLFNIHGDIKGCLFESDDLCGSAVANVSHGPNKAGGAGACISVGPLSVGGGVQWAHLSEPYIWPFDGCKWSKFKLDVRSARAARSAAAGYPVEVRAGAPSPAIKFFGNGGAPLLRVKGPGGQVLDGVAPKKLDLSPGGKIRILRFNGNKDAGPFTVVGLANAQPGHYTIEALPNSPAITRIDRATDQPDAKISGRVTGRGRRRVLRYKVRDRVGQKVTFQEIEQGGVAKTLGTTSRGGRGRIRFNSAPGLGRRKIVAQFELSSIPAERKVIASFKPQTPKLGKPRHIRVRHKGTRLLVNWGKVHGATRYQVAVSLSGRRMAFASTRRNRVTLKRIPAWRSGRVHVRAIDSMRHGLPAGSGPFKATADRPSPFRPLLRCTYGKKVIRCGGQFGSGTRCLPGRLGVSGLRIGPAVLGRSYTKFFRRYSVISRSRGLASFCVRGGEGELVVGSRKGKISLIATTVPRHETRHVGPGSRLHGKLVGTRKIRPGLLVGHRQGSGRVVYVLNGRTVRFLAVLPRGQALSKSLGGRLRSFGLHRSPR